MFTSRHHAPSRVYTRRSASSPVWKSHLSRWEDRQMAMEYWRPRTTAQIKSVVITWCSKDGKVKTMSVDTKKAHGILWKYDPEIPAGCITHRTKKSAFPRKKGDKVTVVGECAPPKLRKHNSPGDCVCYWDGSQWICPEEPAGS